MLTGEKLREIWARYGVNGTLVENTFPEQYTAPFYLTVLGEHDIPTLVKEYDSEKEAVEARWDAIARDATKAIGEVLDGKSLDAIMEVVGEGESFRHYNDGKSMMRDWFLKKLGATA